MNCDVTIPDKAPFRIWGFPKADWETFGEHCLNSVAELSLERPVDAA
jgi:hypothetical protein